MPDRKPSQGLGATLGVIALIAVVVGTALVFTRGDDDPDPDKPAGTSTTVAPSESGADLPTISDSDFPTDFTPTLPTLPSMPTPTLPEGSPPPDVPSELLPTDAAFSDMPTDPADIESWFEQNLDEMGQ